MNHENYSRSIEDYLKTIYELTSLHGVASTNHIAAEMEVRPASVTGMIKRLAAAEPPLVEYRKHHGVKLTADGEKTALEILRHHRLLESFLMQVLGFTWDEVHNEAHRLEHVISDKFVERMAEVLGNPTHDPHGDPIPTRDLQMPASAVLCINELKVGQRAVVRRVRHDDAALLRYLEEHGIILQAVLTIKDISPFDSNITLLVEGRAAPLVLSPIVGAEIFVELA